MSVAGTVAYFAIISARNQECQCKVQATTHTLKEMWQSTALSKPQSCVKASHVWHFHSGFIVSLSLCPCSAIATLRGKYIALNPCINK